MEAATDKSAQPRRKYTAPTVVMITTLGDLLDGVRKVLPQQQARLGFEKEGLGLQLWCAGDRSLVKRPAVAIVGTRKVSKEGAARARRLSRELSTAGVVVVSGLAEGVDREAHTAAIEARGSTIAVIGTPIDKAYPMENAELQTAIYLHHLLISQFAPGSRVFPSNFPARNKVMAAISDATVIIEASDTSGTLHQAAECVRLERFLFIARSVAADATLKWPAKFLAQPKVRVLSETDDVLTALREAGTWGSSP